MKYSIFGALAICCLAAGPTFAASLPTIVVGNHNLLPNTANQQVQIFVTGGQPVDGLNFWVQVGDGGAAAGGTDSAANSPTITGVDILGGTIFGPNNTGAQDGMSPLLWSMSTTTPSGTVSANGLLATLSISTVGLGPGITKPLLLDPPIHSTNFGLLNASITDGTLTIVPEPSSIVLALLALVAVGYCGLRRRAAG